VRPRQFIGVPLNQPPEKPVRARCTHALDRRLLPQATPLPRCRLRPATASCQGSWTTGASPSRPTSRSAKWPVSPFVVTFVPGTTRSTPTDCDCLAAMPPSPKHGRCAMLRPSFYSGPTPRLQHFEHPPDQRQAPATKPATEALPALVMPFASWVTWLEGVTPRASGRMCGLPPRHSFSQLAKRQFWPFRGSEHRSYPLPFDHCFSPLLRPIRPSKQHFRQRLPKPSPASPCGPFMVELFTAAGFANGPRTWSRSGSGCHQPGGSPRRHTLNEPVFADRPEPRGRICSQ
jgi:hypothetical protein